MKRKIFFSFHYERDAWRAGQVRNSNVVADEDERGFIDAVDWEKIKRDGEDAIKAWIKNQMDGTSVTAVLIGAETAQRPWVDFEIRESWTRGNALFGIRIHSVKDIECKTDMYGANPLDSICLSNGKPLSDICETYDWVLDSGRANLGLWADKAVQDRDNHKAEIDPKEQPVAIYTRVGANRTIIGPTVIVSPARPWAQ